VGEKREKQEEKLGPPGMIATSILSAVAAVCLSINALDRAAAIVGARSHDSDTAAYERQNISPGALVKILVKSGKKCYKADFFQNRHVTSYILTYQKPKKILLELISQN